jgi:hypothetical protein
MTIENGKLVNKNGTQHKTTSCHQTFCWNGAMHIKDRFEIDVIGNKDFGIKKPIFKGIL